METIVVEEDGTPQGRHASLWARALADATGAQLINVSNPGGGPSILDVAEGHDAGLIVVNSDPPATADHLARHSRRPFAVVPTDALVHSPKRLAVGLDGSPGADAAAAWCAAVAPVIGADVVAVDVVDAQKSPTVPLSELHEDAEHELSEHRAAPLLAAGLPVIAEVIDDEHRGPAILRAIAEARADALVIGARALTGLRLLHAEGVTAYALRHSRVPVIVVPALHPVTGVRDGGTEAGFAMPRIIN